MGFLKRMASALVFLAGSDRRVDRMPAERFARLAGTTMLIGMVWGLLLVGLWDILFQLTWPHHLNWIAPAVGCALAMVAGPYRLAAIAMI